MRDDRPPRRLEAAGPAAAPRGSGPVRLQRIPVADDVREDVLLVSERAPGPVLAGRKTRRSWCPCGNHRDSSGCGNTGHRGGRRPGGPNHISRAAGRTFRRRCRTVEPRRRMPRRPGRVEEGRPARRAPPEQSAGQDDDQRGGGEPASSRRRRAEEVGALPAHVDENPAGKAGRGHPERRTDRDEEAQFGEETGVDAPWREQRGDRQRDDEHEDPARRPFPRAARPAGAGARRRHLPGSDRPEAIVFHGMRPPGETRTPTDRLTMDLARSPGYEWLLASLGIENPLRPPVVPS